MTFSRYLPHSESDIQEMLASIGTRTTADLFAHIPASLRLDGGQKDHPFNTQLEGPLDEPSLRRRFWSLSQSGAASGILPFIGAGYYPHTVPAATRQLLLRSEFYTAYTPYQPEVAQGTLQAIFEFQTIVTQLTGCEVSNASLYNGASATAEAALMALRLTGRKKIITHQGLHPTTLAVLRTHLAYSADIDVAAYDRETGTTDTKDLAQKINADTAAVIIQNPNFFGCVEELRGLANLAHDSGALFVVVVSDVVSLGVLEAPAKLGADVVVGEAGFLGQGLNFGGPGVGYFATSEKNLRQLPGRICGETVDRNGRRAFVLTLSTREQHIRRQKATSNICTNQSLCALAFTITMSLLGKQGFSELARLNLAKQAYLTQRLKEWKIKPLFSGAVFNERVFGPLKAPAAGLLDEVQRQGFVGGLPLGECFPDVPELHKCVLICATEEHSRSQIESMTTALGKVNR